MIGGEAALRFLLEAGEALSSSLDYQKTLRTLVELSVPSIGDWCAVDLLDDQDRLQRLAVAHRDPAKIALVKELETLYPDDPGSPTGSRARLRRGQLEWASDIPDELILKAARDGRHLELLRALALRSFISAPLIHDGQPLGLFSVVTAESGRQYTESDAEVVRELARRASTAIAHARTHKAVSEAEQFTRSVVEGLVDPMVVYDSEWRGRYENEAAAQSIRSTGRAQSIVGLTLWEAFPNLKGTTFERQMQKAMRERIPTNFIDQVRGSNRWTDVRCYPLTDGGVAAIWRDITEHKRAELTMTYLARASEAFGTSMSEAETVDALVKFVVPEIADWCSISLVEGGRIRLAAVAHVDPAKVQLVRALDDRYPNRLDGNTRTARVIRSGQPDLLEHITEAMIDAAIPDPEYRTVTKQLGFTSAITVPIAIGERVLGALSLVSIGAESSRRFNEGDVRLAEELGRRAAIAVERGRLYEQMADARQLAEDANSAKTSFLARMSHELRTPLNAIGGYAQLLSMGLRGALNEEQKADLERIEHSQHHLSSLIEDILNYAKIEAGRLSYDITDVAVGEVLAAIEPLFAIQLRGRALRYTLEPVPADLRARADGDKLHQILINLVSNAIKFSPDGESITISVGRTGSTVTITVSDTGIGIPGDKIDKIFEPFVQLPRAGRVLQGTGLGLAISRDLARAMHGELRAEPQERGTRFVLSLPAS